MYYAFNAFTGRLVATSQLRAYASQGLRSVVASTVVPAKLAGAAPVANASGQASPVSDGKFQYAPVREKIKRLQEQFQRDPDVPVYLLRGTSDLVIVYACVALAIVGLGVTFAGYKKCYEM